MGDINSVGKCFFCNQEFSNAGIARHLNTHLSKQSEGRNTGTSFHVKIGVDPRWGGAGFFLNLWVDGDALMRHIDMFLRRIWLECCGHMSAFTNPKAGRTRYSVFDMEDRETDDERMMESAIKDVLAKGVKLKYQYDFGSTTELQLTVVEQFSIPVPTGIILLSRNEPLELLCDVCGSAAATTICTVCDHPSRFCKKCAKKHAKECDDFADYSALPVVNSPRMGVCAYEGGSIDTGRDGVFVKKK